MSPDQTIETLVREAKRGVERRYREGRAAEIPAFLRDLVRRSGLNARVAPEIRVALREADAQVRRALFGEMQAQTALPASARAAFAPIVRRALSDLGKADNDITQDVTRLLGEAIRTGESPRAVVDRITQKLEGKRHTAQTAVDTARAAFDRTARVEAAKEAGVQYFRYTGPPAERGFCKQHIDKVYTLAEIEALNNGQGLPVLQFMGGYNCRHRWVPIVDPFLDMPDYFKGRARVEMVSQSELVKRLRQSRPGVDMQYIRWMARELRKETEKAVRELGVPGRITVEFGNYGAQWNGVTELLNNLRDGKRLMGNAVRIELNRSDNGGVYKMAGTIRHELQHVLQGRTGKAFFNEEDGWIYWKSQRYITIADFRAHARAMDTASTRVEYERLFNIYKQWPWEAEAFAHNT
jgi:hypothetical protein